MSTIETFLPTDTTLVLNMLSAAVLSVLLSDMAKLSRLPRLKPIAKGLSLPLKPLRLPRLILGLFITGRLI